jgi:hypothetical protein
VTNRDCKCSMCLHGLWDKDCFICTTSKIHSAGRPILLGSDAVGGGAFGSGAPLRSALGCGPAGGIASGAAASGSGGGASGGAASGGAASGGAASGGAASGGAGGAASFHSDPSQTAFSRPQKRKRCD